MKKATWEVSRRRIWKKQSLRYTGNRKGRADRDSIRRPSYENLVKLEWQTAYGTESFPKEAMLDMRIKAYYRIPKSASKKKRAAMLAGEIRPTKKPDMDNVVKIIADSLNNLAYYDDTQIVDCQCRKFYSENPRVEVTIINLSKEE